MAERILALGGNAFQFFTKNPRGRAPARRPTPEETERLISLLRDNGMAPPLAHAPYTYNPAAVDDSIRAYTEESMRGEIEFLETIPGSLYNFHPGCHVGQGTETGIGHISGILNRVMKEDMSTTVLLETMAGKGTEIGKTFDELAEIISQVDEPKRKHLGVCLDTCHVHDGGYDIKGDLDGVLEEFDRVVGLGRLKAIHLNDSMNPEGAHKDRHAKLGEGHIGLEALVSVINHPLLRDLPFYLETPNDEEGYAREIALLREARDD